jgi:hypothetical protein
MLAVAVAKGRSCARRALGRSAAVIGMFDDAARTATVADGELCACVVVASLTSGVSGSGISAGSMIEVGVEQVGRWEGERQVAVGGA